MNSRERIKTIIAGEPTDRCGLWLGNPHKETWPILHDHFDTQTEEDVRLLLGDDLRWIMPRGYTHPEGHGMFYIPGKIAHGTLGPFAAAKEVAEIDDYDWPRLDYLDFTENLARLRATGPFYRASGMWSPFYHNVMDLFGMEQYMMNMYLRPELVHAVTDRVCQFYYDANERLFAQAGTEIDGFFFGNDFGTQLDLICGPKQFDTFIMPWFRTFTEQAPPLGLSGDPPFLRRHPQGDRPPDRRGRRVPPSATGQGGRHGGRGIAAVQGAHRLYGRHRYTGPAGQRHPRCRAR